MNLMGFGKRALEAAGSRAQNAIKRLDCGTQSMSLIGIDLVV